MTQKQKHINSSKKFLLNKIERNEFRYERNEDFELNVIAVQFLEALRVRAKVKKQWYEYPAPMGGIVQR